MNFYELLRRVSLLQGWLEGQAEAYEEAGQKPQAEAMKKAAEQMKKTIGEELETSITDESRASRKGKIDRMSKNKAKAERKKRP